MLLLYTILMVLCVAGAYDATREKSPWWFGLYVVSSFLVALAIVQESFSL